MVEAPALCLVGYRVVPPWTVPPSTRDPLPPPRVVTLSDHLVDPVPDDDTWYATPEAAVPAGRTAGTAPRVLAMGVDPRDAEEVITQRLTLDTSQLVKWPRDGVPRILAGWLLTVGRRRAIDAYRRRSALDERYAAPRPRPE